MTEVIRLPTRSLCQVLLFLCCNIILCNPLKYDGRALCTNCDDTDTKEECHHYSLCYPNQRCGFVDYVSYDGRTRTWTGCVDKTECNKINAFRVPKTGNFATPRCCDGPGCNGLISQPPNRSLCFQCTTADVQGCDLAMLCNSDIEVCSYQKYTVNYKNTPMHQLGCDSLYKCQVANAIKKRESQSTLEYRCCQGQLCNFAVALEANSLLSHGGIVQFNSNQTVTTTPSTTMRLTTPLFINKTTSASTTSVPSVKSTSQTSTTTSPTVKTSTSLPVTTSTMLPVTTSTTLPVTTSTTLPVTTSTTLPVTTSTTFPVTSLQTECHVGQGTGQTKMCSGTTPYCLTNVTNYNNGFRVTHKGCASEQQCYWLPRQTLLAEHSCGQFDEDTLYMKDFQCSYCCTKDLCNSRTVPSIETMYQPNKSTIQYLTSNQNVGNVNHPRDLTATENPTCYNAMTHEQCIHWLDCSSQSHHLAYIYCRKHCNLCDE